MVVGISRVVQTKQSPLRHCAQKIGLARRLEAGALRIVIFRLSRIDGELLLEISTVRSNIAEPQSYLRGQLVLDGYIPSLLMLVVPRARLPMRRGAAGRDEATRRVHVHPGRGVGV